MIPQERCQKIAARWTQEPVNNIGDHQEDQGGVLRTKLHGKRHTVSQTTLDPPLKTSDMKRLGGILKKRANSLRFFQKNTS